MKNAKRAETLVIIMVSVIILSFIAVSIFSILDFDKNITKTYSQNIDKLILKSNAENIIKKMYLENVLEGEKFYIHKDNTKKEYKILTGTTNEKYENIDKIGDFTENGNEKLYKRRFRKNQNILENDEKWNDRSIKYFDVDIDIVDY